MDIRICPNCSIVFDFEKRLWTLNFGTVECPCCKHTILPDECEKVKNV